MVFEVTMSSQKSVNIFIDCKKKLPWLDSRLRQYAWMKAALIRFKIKTICLAKNLFLLEKS